MDDDELRRGRREEQFAHQVGGKAERRREARSRPPAILSWFGAFGIIGWSIALPAILGALLGRWVDEAFPGPISWTLTLLLAGIAMGSVGAWLWLRREGGGDGR